MSFVRRVLPILALVALVATPGQAGLVTVTGVDFLSAPPASLQQDSLTSDTQIFAFQEQQNLTLPQDVAVSITTPGVYGCTSTIPCTVSPSVGTLAAGLVVNSYLLHFDPVSVPDGEAFRNLQGTVVFDGDEQVVGIIAGVHQLRGTDSIFAAAGTSYPSNNTTSATELGMDYSLVQLTTDGLRPNNKVGFLASANNNLNLIDEIRIITVMAPEPADFLLLASGLAALGLWRKRIS